MRDVTAWFVILAPLAIFGTDMLVWGVFGASATITDVVRSWAARSSWIEWAYLVGATLLYVHLFRSWPEG